MKHLVIADLGTGNLRSVSNAIKHVAGNLSVTLSGDAQTIRSANNQKLIVGTQSNSSLIRVASIA